MSRVISERSESWFGSKVPYPAFVASKDEMDEDVTRLNDQACNVDGQHQDEASHRIGAIECPHETIQQCGNVGHPGELPCVPALYDCPEGGPVNCSAWPG